MIHWKERAAISERQALSRGGAQRSGSARDIGVSVASASCTDEAPLGGTQALFEFFTASQSQILLLSAQNCDCGVAESITSDGLKGGIGKRDTFEHTLNDIKIRLQTADELCEDQFEMVIV